MDTNRKMRDLGLSSSTQHLPRQPPPQQLMPWPVLQRRRIEKLKDDRLNEFERACDESFEWLENYYQGCVYAALQNRDYHETADGGGGRAFSRSISTDHGRQSQHFTTDQQYDEDLLPISPYASGYYSGQGRSTASPGYHHSLPHQRQQRQQLLQQHQQHQHQPRQKVRHTPKSSPAKFRLKSPKTPNVTRIGSPTSPYDRQHHQHRNAHLHIHTTPRKKLRVTARPSSMRAQRALKAMRKRTASFQKGSTRHRDSKIDEQQQQQHQNEKEQDQYRVLETEKTNRRDTSSVPPKQPQQHQQESSHHSPLDSAHNRSDHQDMVTHSRHSPTTPAEDKSFTSDADKSFTYERGRSFNSENGRSFIAELRASTFKTPAKGHSSREIRSSYSQARETNDMELDSDEYQSMPGSKARDSMTLKSPVNRSDTSIDQDMESPLRTSLIHSAARNRSSSSVAKRSSDFMESDQHRPVDAESKRPKSSPFIDALIPIRSHSPDIESRETTKAGGSTREGRTKFSDPTTTTTTTTTTATTETAITTISRSAEGTFTENGSRWREPELNFMSTKNRGSDPNDRLPTRSTTPSTTPHQRSDYGSSFPQRPSSGIDDVTHGVHDESRSRINGDSIEHRPNGMSNTTNQGLDAQSTARKQAERSDSLNHPGNHQDDRSRRQTDRKEETNTLLTARTGRSAAGDEMEQSTRFKPPTSRATLSSSYISTSSDTGALRSNKVTMTLPEKRTLGSRRPTTTSSHTGTAAFMPPSRLTKQAPTSIPNGAGSAAESQGFLSAIQSDNSTALQATSNSRMARVGPQSTLKDIQPSGQTIGAGPNGMTSSAVPTGSSHVTSGLLGHQGAPSRPPLTSNRAAVEGSGINGSTSTSLPRPENQGSLLPRKPFALPTTTTSTTTSTAKSVFSLKKPTSRPVLPDGVSSAQLVSSSSSSALARPPGSSLAMMQARIDQHAREPTPTRDFHSKTVATQRTDLNPTASASKSTLSLSSVISSRKESMSIAANGVKAEMRVEPTQSVSKSTNDGGHVFAVPGPVRHQHSAPSWMTNAAQTDRNHRPFKTILPEINSDEEDSHHDESGTTRTRRKTAIPEWASWEELNRAMEEQKHWNPEEIFGQLPLLDMAEIFPGREKKSNRSRSSSAHWGASDALTPQEVTKYNQDMGWTGNE